jgi:hypothetical protein
MKAAWSTEAEQEEEVGVMLVEDHDEGGVWKYQLNTNNTTNNIQ